VVKIAEIMHGITGYDHCPSSLGNSNSGATSASGTGAVAGPPQELRRQRLQPVPVTLLVVPTTAPMVRLRGGGGGGVTVVTAAAASDFHLRFRRAISSAVFSSSAFVSACHMIASRL